MQAGGRAVGCRRRVKSSSSVDVYTEDNINAVRRRGSLKLMRFNRNSSQNDQGLCSLKSALFWERSIKNEMCPQRSGHIDNVMHRLHSDLQNLKSHNPSWRRVCSTLRPAGAESKCLFTVRLLEGGHHGDETNSGLWLANESTDKKCGSDCRCMKRDGLDNAFLNQIRCPYWLRF